MGRPKGSRNKGKRRSRLCSDENADSLENLRAWLAYDALTGTFSWLREGKRSGGKPGSLAVMGLTVYGYRRINFGGRRYFVHRLAWFYVHGKWPSADIDHINGDRTDNRLENLREATRSQNNANAKCRRDNKVGLKGVIRLRSKRWAAQINAQRLGSFDTPEEAHAAYLRAAKERYGEYARGA